MEKSFPYWFLDSYLWKIHEMEADTEPTVSFTDILYESTNYYL